MPSTESWPDDPRIRRALEQARTTGILSLNGLGLKAVGDWIADLPALTELRLDSNRLVALPPAIGRLTKLRKLWLFGNGLRSLPPTLGRLTALEDLWLDENLLTELPAEIGELTSLTLLRVNDNQLRALPTSLGDLVNLHQLSLARNELSSLPATIGRLTQLRELILDGNELTRLPETLGQLPHLQVLSVEDNQLTSLPWQLGPSLRDGSLRVLAVGGNPLHDALLRMLERGPQALGNYLTEFESAEAVREVKVLLIGRPTTGKSSLLAALRDQPFLQDRESTHGIDIQELQVPGQPDAGPGPALTLRCWDFGGQPAYEITHQFFYSSRALYLLVWNTRAGVQLSDVVGWLHRIRARIGGNAQVILVGTHSHNEKETLDLPRLRRMFPGMIRDSFYVDNKTGQGIGELYRRLAEHAASMDHIGTVLPASWTRIRDEVRRRAESAPYLSLHEYRGLCEATDVHDLDTQLGLADLMHDLGQVIYHGAREGLKDILVLDPEWLAQAIASVLTDPPTMTSGGVLDHGRLPEIWQSVAGGPQYRAEHYSYLLRLLEGFDASWRLPDGRQSIIAEMVPATRPPLPWLDEDPLPNGVRRLKAYCRFSGDGLDALDVPPALGLISALTVRHHQHTTGNLWRTGVFLRHANAEFGSTALIELRSNGGGPAVDPDAHTQVLIEVRAPDPGFFFDVLLESVGHLVRQRWPGLTLDYDVPCLGQVNARPCTHHFSFTELRSLRNNGTYSVQCLTCQTHHDVSLLLTGFVSDGPLPAGVAGRGALIAEITPIAAERYLERLAADMAHMVKAVGDVAHEVHEVKLSLAQATETVWRTLVAVNYIVNDVPRLFTLNRREPVGVEKLNVLREYFAVWLWCEHPGEYHPVCRLTFDRPQRWVLQVAPYARLVFQALKPFLPLVDRIAHVALDGAQLAEAQRHIQAVESFDASALRAIEQAVGHDHPVADRLPTADDVQPPTGNALSAFRALLVEINPMKIFEGLEPLPAVSGEVVWVCKRHALLYR